MRKVEIEMRYMITCYTITSLGDLTNISEH